MTDLLVADHIHKKYGNYTALNDLSITVPKGSIFGLLGPNGAGKTTLIRIINQITMPVYARRTRPLQVYESRGAGDLSS